MTNKNITFCVKREDLTKEQIKTLHGWCLEAGADEFEDLAYWVGCAVGYIGIDHDNIIYSYACLGNFNKNLLKFSEVQSFLGLIPNSTTPEVSVANPPETPTAPLQQAFATTPDDCMPVEENVPYIDTNPYNFLYDIVKPSVKEFSLEVAITMTGDDLVYTIFHPLFDKEFKVVSEEEYEDLIKGFATLSKFYKPL